MNANEARAIASNKEEIKKRAEREILSKLLSEIEKAARLGNCHYRYQPNHDEPYTKPLETLEGMGYEFEYIINSIYIKW